MTEPNFVYLISNEDIRSCVALTPGARDVLTVAASGDQALFYRMGGATRVDTYDINPHARAIQDIKTAAIRTMTHGEYISFIRELADYKHLLSPIDLKNPTHIRLLNMIPKTSADMAKKIMIQNSFFKMSHMPSAMEYATLQERLDTFFNFIHSDIADLHTRINYHYDVINISNIFDWLPYNKKGKRIEILSNLTTLLNPGGKIVYPAQEENPKRYKGIKIQNGNTTLEYEKHIDGPLQPIILFQRTR